MWFLLVLASAIVLRAWIRARWRPWRIEQKLAEPVASIERASADALLEMRDVEVHPRPQWDPPRYFTSPFCQGCRQKLELPRGDVEALGLDVLMAHRELLRGLDAWDQLAGETHVPEELLPTIEAVYQSCRLLGGNLSPDLLGRARRQERKTPLIGVVAQVPGPQTPLN